MGTFSGELYKETAVRDMREYFEVNDDVAKSRKGQNLKWFYAY